MTQDAQYRPAAVAFEVHGEMNPALEPEDAASFFNNIIGDVTRDCVDAGSWMIGHVKAALDGGSGFLSMSSTTDDGNVRNRGALTAPLGSYSLLVNVIVYGLDEKTVDGIFRRRASEALKDAKIETVIDPGCQDPECNDPLCNDPHHRSPIIPLG